MGNEYSFMVDLKGMKCTELIPLEKCFDAIRTRNELNETTIKKLQEENKKLKDPYYRDDEIKRLQSVIDGFREELRRGFKISASEDIEILKWQHDHEKEAHKCDKSRLGAIGGAYEYIFIPTSIGTSGTIRCNCGAEFEFRKLG